MEFNIWIYYLLAVVVLTATPGPSVLLCVVTSIKQDFKTALITSIGSLLAIIGIMSISFTGLGIIISSSEYIFNIIKYIGAGYLIYLGYKNFTSKEESYKFNSKVESEEKSKLKYFIDGFMVGASNPKAIVFFTALFPQFINQSEPLLQQYLIFVTTFAVLELSWLLFYSYLGAKSSDWFLKKGRAKLFNRLSGSIFIGAGLLLSTLNKNK